ncbi:MAG: VC0807 family protein [Marinagarivorans sp.]
MAAAPAPQENMLVNLLINVAAPSIILSKFSGEHSLGPTWGLIVALAFPIVYGVWDFIRRRKVNFFSAIGVFSTFLTGGMTLLKLPPEYVAIKEASIPLLFGLATLGSLYTPFPLVRTFLYNEKVLQVERVNYALKQYGTEQAFERTLVIASWMLAGSFFLSAVLNYGLAKYLLVSEPGTEAYNAELGRMTALSLPVITIPSMLVLVGALWYLLNRIKSLTHLKLEEIFNDGQTETKTTADM